MAHTIRSLIEKIQFRLRREFQALKYGRKKQSLPNIANRVEQITLMLKYQELLFKNLPLPSLKDVGFRGFSQTDEDGILLYLFSLFGTTNQKVVEICCGDGIECNSANWVIQHGWKGLLIDGNQKKINQGNYFYRNCKDTLIFPPKLSCSWVERENVNNILENYSFSGEIDLFSLDMDGVDYWIWESLDVINPRVVVLEYQSLWPPEKSVTVPYRRDFVRSKAHPEYFGASLAAFQRLGEQKGYRLVGCNRYCFNAFFVRNDLPMILPTVSVDSCLSHPKVAKEYQDAYAAEMRNQLWVEV